MGSAEFTLRLAHASLKAERQIAALAPEGTAASGTDPQHMKPGDV